MTFTIVATECAEWINLGSTDTDPPSRISFVMVVLVGTTYTFEPLLILPTKDL
jgi:hypothetical protein